jgi:DMSO reductase anchor subunit
VLARRHRRRLRAAFWIGGIAIPLAWILLGLPDLAAALAANVACLGGLLAERWLFFAEAKHTVRLYHGESRT